jgi:hypothetical protein
MREEPEIENHEEAVLRVRLLQPFDGLVNLRVPPFASFLGWRSLTFTVGFVGLACDVLFFIFF